MKIYKVLLSALVLSAVFSAITTELSMRHSTNIAVSTAQDFELTDENLANLHIQNEPIDGDLNKQIDSEELSQEEVVAGIKQIQQLSSVYQYPGYWLFWLNSFLKIFITTLVVALVQSFLIIRISNKNNSVQ